MIQLKVAANYSTKIIGNLRGLYNLKSCYNNNLLFLKKKELTSQSLSNRILVGSKNYKNYRFLNKFYINYLRNNFSSKSDTLKNGVKFNNFFVKNYKQYLAMNDLNRTILWRLLECQPLFKKVKKKKN